MRPIGTLLVAAASAALLTGSGSLPSPTASPVAAALDRPNIVVIYADDFSPLATWLWKDPERTPTLARFARDGIWFRNATGSTPMCCPARGNLLTGRYGHRTGITKNDLGPYEPAGALGALLQGAGY